MKFQEMFGLQKQDEKMQAYNVTKQDLDMVVTQVLDALKERNDDMTRHLKMNDRREEKRYANVRTDIKTVDEKHSKKYAEPWEVDAIKNAVSDKAEIFVRSIGIQLTLDSITPAGRLTLEELTYKRNVAEKQFRKDLRQVKNRILVLTKKYLGMKGNARNDHFKSIDVDKATRFIKELTTKDLGL